MLEWLKNILGEAYTEEIDKAVAKEIGKNFVARADFNATNETKKQLEEQVKERDTQLEELKKVDADGLNQKITELQKQNDDARTEYETKLKNVRLNAALENRLIKDGAVSTKAVKALLDMEKIGIDGENLTGYDDQIKTIKETEKWAFAPKGKTGIEQQPSGGDEGTLESAILGEMYPTKE